MLKQTIQDALNKHLTEELFSSYLYYAMSAYMEAEDLKGMASWMRVQAQEELIHVQKFFTYINDRGGRVLLAPVAGPANEWESPLAAFRAAYDHECKISRLIGELSELTRKEADHATFNFLQWFVGEQVEEEASVKEIVGQLKIVGSEGQGLFLLDRELGLRTFVMPPATTAAQ